MRRNTAIARTYMHSQRKLRDKAKRGSQTNIQNVTGTQTDRGTQRQPNRPVYFVVNSGNGVILTLLPHFLFLRFHGTSPPLPSLFPSPPLHPPLLPSFSSAFSYHFLLLHFFLSFLLSLILHFLSSLFWSVCHAIYERTDGRGNSYPPPKKFNHLSQSGAT